MKHINSKYSIIGCHSRRYIWLALRFKGLRILSVSVIGYDVHGVISGESDRYGGMGRCVPVTVTAFT
jgi:hypothetical protein